MAQVEKRSDRDGNARDHEDDEVFRRRRRPSTTTRATTASPVEADGAASGGADASPASRANSAMRVAEPCFEAISAGRYPSVDSGPRMVCANPIAVTKPPTVIAPSIASQPPSTAMPVNARPLTTRLSAVSAAAAFSARYAAPAAIALSAT